MSSVTSSNHHAFRAAFAALAFSTAAAGCGRQSEPSANERSPDVGPHASATGAHASADVLHWDDPAGWSRRPGGNPMRKATYAVAHAPGDTEDAECTVTSFGPGQGGGVDANVDRWVRQFDASSASALDRGQKNVRGIKITTVGLSGTYRAMAMPGSPEAPPKPRSRLLGAVVEAPGETYFFKLTGPEATVRAAGPAFDKLLESVRGGGTP